MKFPLSACPFQPLELTASEKDTIQSISDGILTETMAEYERMLVHGNGVLDTERWKLIKRKENLAAYQDRCALAVTLQASSSTTKPTVDSVEDPISPPPAPAASLGGSAKSPLQRVLWHGTINCDLDDLMLGIVNQNADMWKGEMPSTSVSLFSAEAMSTLTLSAFCAERHKVMWLLHTMVPCERGKPSLDLCSVCTKDLSKSLLPFMNKACRICSGRICARCRIPKRISFLNRRTRGVIKKNIDICTRCVHTSAHMSALTVAQGELALENPTAIFYESAVTRSVSSISSVSSG
ncbi:hypothetical protein PC115_g22593 [Phytophthora cactorum]|uniref:FYVE-type domain-containing protein n=1 Tax=Phytophthora cactorum TaxID=29920 RepID=A0A8T1AG77_9STRA|nr:hypothetical protein PC115_g22593 [Phytophthora cactorum]